jgi:hypothetical protein
MASRRKGGVPMDVQEAVQRILAMGFQDVTEQYNAEYHSDFAYVFFHPQEGPGGLRCWCDDERDVFRILDFLEDGIRFGRMEVIGNPLEGVAGHHNQIGGYSCRYCGDQGCMYCCDWRELCM